MPDKVAAPNAPQAKTAPRSGGEAGGYMPETRWSLVQRIQGSDDQQAIGALGELMKAYWQPLQGYALGRGASPADADDAVQGFYEMLISRSSMLTVSQERGRLRAFLRSSFERYLRDQWDKRSAAKRGGGRQHISLDQEDGDHHRLKELSDNLTPEKLYYRLWVLILLSRVMDTLQANYRRRGK